MRPSGSRTGLLLSMERLRRKWPVPRSTVVTWSAAIITGTITEPIPIGACGDPIGARRELDMARRLGQTLLVAHCLQQVAIFGEYLVIGVKPAIVQIIEMRVNIESRKHDERALGICGGILRKSGSDPVQHQRF